MRGWELEAVTFLDLMMVMWSVNIALIINFLFWMSHLSCLCKVNMKSLFQMDLIFYSPYPPYPPYLGIDYLP